MWDLFSLAEKAEGLPSLFSFFFFTGVCLAERKRPAFLGFIVSSAADNLRQIQGLRRDTLARGLISGFRASIAWARSVAPLPSRHFHNFRAFHMASDATATAAAAAPAAAVKKPKLHGRAFYESIGSPKYIVAPMVDQSEFVRPLVVS